MAFVLNSAASKTTLSTRADGGSDDANTVLVLTKVVPALLLICGIVGNIITIAALQRTKDKTMIAGSRVYHTCLAVVDLVALTVSILRFWLVALTQTDIYSSPTGVCKVLPWLEFSFLMAQPWVLVAMVVQLHEGLRLNYTPGQNVTLWKARVFGASAVFLALVFNIHRVFLFGAPEQTTSHPDSTRVTSGHGNDVPSHVDLMSQCVPFPGAYATFANDVWPWFSLTASLGLPLCGITIVMILVVRLLFVRCRQNARASAPVRFKNMVVSIIILSIVTLITSFPLCFLCYTDARYFWTDYPNMFASKDSRQGERFYVSSIFRFLYYGHFALRWIVTCWCNRLWRVILSMCRCRK